ncbi:hypothetical protein BX600DRAFT_432812 [Xylariales sp. PMI_506]|nr:hypothetical protein BX600DRAFT_432812 [Xylariales sp. PMI_506]
MSGTRDRGSNANPESKEEEDDDDYMSMDFLNAVDTTYSKPETSLQRRQRLRREGEIRGRPKSKAELEAETKADRERALATSLLTADGQDPRYAASAGDRARAGAAATPLPPPPPASKSKGLAMMRKMGYVVGGALGPAGANKGATTEPIRLNIKEDRGGVGLDAQRKRALEEAAEREGGGSNKMPRVVVDENEFRERNRREQETARREKQVYAAQKVAERMDEDREEDRGSGGEGGKKKKIKKGAENNSSGDDDDDKSSDGDGESDGGNKKKKKKKRGPRPLPTRRLRSVNVLWRGLVRQRQEAERERRMRYDLEQSLSRLPTYEDADEDADDRRALGRTGAGAGPGAELYASVEEDGELDEEDPELAAFSALEPDERLRRLVEYLRHEHRYCFWCKYTYPDEEMEGCPGLTEEDHD